MAFISTETHRVFFFLLIMVSYPACTGISEGGMFMDKHEASVFLHRTRRANFFLEEFRQGNLERECVEEKCSYEEAKEIFATTQQLENFWRTYTAVDHCLSSPCKNGATCTRHIDSYICKCPPGFHGFNCDKVRSTSGSCRNKNGGCEHFCRQLPNRSFTCFCAPGYGLDQDNSSCLPQDSVVCGRQLVHFAPRIVNGQICPPGQCPWQALLTEHNKFTCGAIVLSDVWILTAAHCVHMKPIAIFHVTVGKNDLHVREKTEQQRRVLKVFIHRNYNYSTYDSDLALLKLHRPVKLGSYVVPICLPARNSTFMRTLAMIGQSTVSGWGRLLQFGSSARYLQRLVVPTVHSHECRLHTQLNITKNMFCAGRRSGGQDACEGDSGGPLVKRYKKTWFLTGVVSWGKGCARENMYGVYAKVSNFLEWIENIIATG
ncbi:coagulation factor VII [Nematolebias whitei]|uniref:coagulation factor VII n=1 Tax=Nematolebias whitei TaxID=451745 RepID=UPI00189B49FA|nr:coagulation factor VII [Nematolebias whitei]